MAKQVSFSHPSPSQPARLLILSRASFLLPPARSNARTSSTPLHRRASPSRSDRRAQEALRSNYHPHRSRRATLHPTGLQVRFDLLSALFLACASKETWCLFPGDFPRPYFESGCIDICQPDISHSGGISETRKIALMAEVSRVASFILFPLFL